MWYAGMLMLTDLCAPQVVTLLTGRVYILLGCSHKFARMAVPMLIDSVVSRYSHQLAACLSKTMAGTQMPTCLDSRFAMWSGDDR